MSTGASCSLKGASEYLFLLTSKRQLRMQSEDGGVMRVIVPGASPDNHVVLDVCNLATDPL
jgi:hypothetical protein